MNRFGLFQYLLVYMQITSFVKVGVEGGSTGYYGHGSVRVTQEFRLTAVKEKWMVQRGSKSKYTV